MAQVLYMSAGTWQPATGAATRPWVETSSHVDRLHAHVNELPLPSRLDKSTVDLSLPRTNPITIGRRGSQVGQITGDSAHSLT